MQRKSLINNGLLTVALAIGLMLVPTQSHAQLENLGMTKMVLDYNGGEYSKETIDKYLSKLDFFEDLEWLEVRNVKDAVKMDAAVKLLKKNRKKRLTHLEFHNTDFTKLPAELSQYRDLTYIQIDNSSFNKLPKEIGDFLSLDTLIIRNTTMKSIPADFGYLSSIVYVDFSNDSLTKIPDEACKITRLLSLNLSNNPLKKLPKDFNKFLSLEYLNLSGIHFTKVNDELAKIAKFKAMRFLYLNDFNLGMWPSEVGAMKDLEELYLDDNAIDIITFDITRYPKLKKVSLKNNGISPELQEEIKANYPTVEFIF